MNVLSFDIGGTSCRLAFFENKTLVERACIETSSLKDESSLVAFTHRVLGFTRIDCIGLAGAGPVIERKLSFTNATISLSEETCRKVFGTEKLYLINDFSALAFSLATERREQAQLVHGTPRKITQGTMLAALGAGTGFGCAALWIDESGKALAIPSEGGHAFFPFREDEIGFQRFLRKQYALVQPEIEDVLSGRGLERLHEYLSGEKRSAQEVSKCRSEELTSLFGRFYARACRNWILSLLCRGGLWIAGGLALKNPDFVFSQAFAEELADFDTPIYLLEKEESALWGAAYYAIAQG